VIFSTCN